MNRTTEIYQQLQKRLGAVRRREDRARALQGLFFTAGLFTALLLTALLLEQTFALSSAVRTTLFWIVVAAGAAVLLWRAAPPLLRLLGVLPGEGDERTAARIGGAFPGVHDRLLNTLQLYREQETHLYSDELTEAALLDAEELFRNVDFSSAVGFGAARRAATVLGTVAGALLLLWAIFPSAFPEAAYRLWHYGEAFAAPVPFRLVVEPGNRLVTKGDNVRVTVRVVGERQSELRLLSKPDAQAAYEERVLHPDSTGRFSYDFLAMRSSVQYFAAVGDVRSDEYRLDVADRPIVTLLRLRLTPPAYARLPQRDLDDNTGDVTGLKGTRIRVTVETNKELSAASLLFSDSSRIPLDVSGKGASGTMVLLNERTYHIQLADRQKTANAEPIEYTLRIIPDAYPTASVTVPGANVDVTDNSTLPMLFRISDDYGFSRLRLAYRLVQSRYEKAAEQYTTVDVPLPRDAATELSLPYTWNLESLNLVPEDVVSYHIEVFDNDNVSGPKRAASEEYLLRLPSIQEVFADADSAHRVSTENLQEVLKAARDAKENLDELQRELKANDRKADWETKKQAEELTKRYAEMQKKIEDVQRTVESMVNTMDKQRLLSPETLAKYNELQQLMEEMRSSEFAEAMKRLQEAMQQQVSPEMLQQALQQFSFSEEQFRKSIERTMNLLKRIQIEQKMDEAVRRAQDLEKKQEELQKKTADAANKDGRRAEELASEQRDLQQELQELRKQMEQLQKNMEEFPAEMPLSAMEQAQKELNDSKLDQQLGEIAQQMQGQQMAQAAQGQQQAMQSMRQLSRRLQDTKQALQANQQRQIVREMRRTQQDLLDLSRKQEQLKNESQSLEQNSQRFRENAQQQMELLRDLNGVTGRVAALSQKTFGVTPEMGKALGDAMRQMDQATESLEQRNGGAAGQQQAAAMGALNQGAALLEDAMQAMMQGSGQGMGMAGFLQRLRQLAGQQQGINQGTEQLGMSQQQAAAMARLAAEQGIVRKSLEQLTREAAGAGELKKMLGDLGKTAQEMREVQTDLAQGAVNPETTRKQERILSRLLESQRSTRERDFEEKRKATTGTNVARSSPGPIDLSTQEGRNRLRRDFLRALEEGYSRDYQELIRKYFEALEQQQPTQTP